MLSRYLRPLWAIGLALVAGTPALAQTPDVPEALIRKHIPELRRFLETPVIDISVQAQNEQRGDMTEAEILVLDKQWRAETEADEQPLIAAVLTNPASSYLTQVQARAGGLYTALFVMDKNGLNVGQSVPTADYWQGDEDKFQKTFPKGADAVFIDRPEYDDTFKTWIVQVNLTLSRDGMPIGAATVDLNIEELTRRASQGR